MLRRPVVRESGRGTRLCLRVLAALTGLWAVPALGQATFTVSGTLVIQGGGTNTATVRYTQLTVGPGAGSVTISLSAAFPTLVIRGPQAFAEACDVPGDCWDSDLCLEKTGNSPGVCGWSGTELPAGCTGLSALHAKLDDCVALWRREQRDATAFDGLFARTDQCIGAGSQVASLPAACPGQRYRDAYDTVVFDVIAASQNQMQTSGGQLITDDVRTHLKRIGDWYGAYRQIYPASQGDAANDRVWGATSRVLGTFWKAAYAKAGVPAPGSSNPSDALLDALFQQGLGADRTVLLAALTPPIPIRTSPLVEVMGDALHSMSARLAQVGLYHDLACRFRDNPAALQYRCANDQVRTEIAELVRLLAASAHPGELAQVLGRPAPTTTTSSWVPWKSVFSALSTQQSGLSPPFQAAVLDALPGISQYTPDLIAPPPPQPGVEPPAPPRLPPPLMDLARIVQEARVRANSYQVTGLFDSRYQGILRAGIQEARVNEVINRVESRKGDLRTEVANYRATRLQLANGVLQQMTNLATQQNVIDEVTQRMEKERQLRADIAGLRTTIEVQEARFGDFMQAYNGLSRIVASKPGTEITHSTATITVRAGDARWLSTPDEPAATDPLGAFVSRAAGVTPAGALSWPIVANKGDILNLSTLGSWSPNCALRTARFTNPLTGQADTFNVPTPTLTGPEGYLLSLSDNRFTATTNQSVHSVDRYTNEGSSRKYCGGADVSVGVSLGPVSLGAHGGAEWCSTRDSGTRTSDVTSDSESRGSESRMSAAFATGIRLPNTPFQTFPAGTLLLVQVRRGGTTRADIQDVQVLQKPSSSIVIGADSDVYLVVNDVVDGACGAPDASALTVSLNQIRPFGAMAQQLGQGMANALGNLHADQALLVEQGRVGPQQMAELRDQAFVDLVLACGVSCSQISYYPAEVLKFFEAWVGKELAAIERKVDARTLERELALIELQHAALAHDLQNLGDQARLLRLMPTWLLKDLGTNVLQSKTHSLVDLLVADLYPIVDLRQPATLRNLDASMLNALLGMNVLLDPVPLDWTGNLVDWSNAAARASENIVARLRDSLGNSPPLNDRILALGIPNPSAPTPPEGRWQRVAPERAQVVWDAIAQRAPFVSIAIEPTDLYSVSSSSTDVMLCNESEPVITAMAIYMVRPVEGGTGFPGLLVPVSIDRNLNFPAVGVMKNYRIDNDDWLSQGVRVTAGQSFELDERIAALTAEAATPLYRVANGLSPFTKFDIALGGISSAPSYPAPADDATEMVLVFRAQTRNVANVHLAPMCQ